MMPFSDLAAKGAQRTFLAAGLLLPLAVPAGAQTGSEETQPPAQVFSEEVSVRVINVDVIVTDRAGRPIAGLGRDDFELRLDGRVVPITNFYSESAAPLELADRAAVEVTPPETRSPGFRDQEAAEQPSSRRSHVVLLIDHTRLGTNNRKRAFRALREAVARLGEDDLIAVVGVEGRLVFYTDFLFDRQAVDRVLDEVTKVAIKGEVGEIERRQIVSELARGMSGGILSRATVSDDQGLLSRIRAYAASEYDRSLRSLRQIETVASTLAGVPGRKTLLYLGEGIPTRPGQGLYVEYRNRFGGPERGLPQQNFDTNYTREVGRFDLTQAMDQLATAINRAGVTLYSIDAENSHGGQLRSVLTEQGATSEAVTLVDENYREPLEYTSKATGGRLLRSSGKLADHLADLVGGLQTFYSLGFTPPPEWRAGTDHDLKVSVRSRGLVVNHREKVWLPNPDEPEASATVAALMYRTLDNPLEIEAVPESPTWRDDGTGVLPVQLQIPIGKLELLPQENTQAASLTIYVSTKDADGNPSRVQKIPFHLAIPNDKVAEARKETAHYPLPLLVRPGDRQVAIGVRDGHSGLFSAIRLDLSQVSQL